MQIEDKHWLDLLESLPEWITKIQEEHESMKDRINVIYDLLINKAIEKKVSHDR
ncbi:hypothetical protein MBAV_004167 [Candidatus Magnetobacterium bavaricum]|uniref:Uncharacterized protein n=1 Tax=Candidatus Magnetobacterium bavaricum TaxID=29290 RepID=A0A0F3GNS7_9BACT|nr:hypothetical protein MBAV_004167 [Candidatus Magnetobacterium bavaricum]